MNFIKLGLLEASPLPVASNAACQKQGFNILLLDQGFFFYMPLKIHKTYYRLHYLQTTLEYYKDDTVRSKIL